MISRRNILLTLVLGAAVTSCGGTAEPTGPNGDSDPNQMPRVIKANPSFATDIQEMFARRGCGDSGCHGAPSPQADLFLGSDPAQNYESIVNVPATSEGRFLRVKPGDAENSYLVIRFEDRQSVGALMPIGLPLDSIDLTNFRNWVNNGAPEN